MEAPLRVNGNLSRAGVGIAYLCLLIAVLPRPNLRAALRKPALSSNCIAAPSTITSTNDARQSEYAGPCLGFIRY